MTKLNGSQFNDVFNAAMARSQQNPFVAYFLLTELCRKYHIRKIESLPPENLMQAIQSIDSILIPPVVAAFIGKPNPYFVQPGHAKYIERIEKVIVLAEQLEKSRDTLKQSPDGEQFNALPSLLTSIDQLLFGVAALKRVMLDLYNRNNDFKKLSSRQHL